MHKKLFKCVRVVYLFLAIIFLSGCFHPRYYPPESINGTLLSLPFPLNDSPIGVSTAEIDISMTEPIITEYNDFVAYKGMVTAVYNLRYVGEESATIDIALLLPVLDSRWIHHSAEEINIQFENEPYNESRTYIIEENIEETKAKNLAGLRTPSMIPFINDVRMYAASDAGTYYPTSFDADEPYPLYNFHILSERRWDSKMTLAASTFRFNRKNSTVIFKGADDNYRYYGKGSYNLLTGLTTFSHVTGRDWISRERYEIFVIGDDTLTWDIAPTSRERVDASQTESVADIIYLSHATQEITPRKYFRDMQNTMTHPYQLQPSDFLLRQADEIRVRSSGYVNTHEFDVPKIPNATIVTMNFYPNQERKIILSYPIYSSMEWNKKTNQSLYHHTLLTEAAKYWAFFDSLHITAHHPDDAVEIVITDDFTVLENKSILSTHNMDDNIYFGFILNNETVRSSGSSLFWLLI